MRLYEEGKLRGAEAAAAEALLDEQKSAEGGASNASTEQKQSDMMALTDARHLIRVRRGLWRVY